MWKTLRTKAICRHSSGEIFGKARGTSSNGRALDSHSRGTGIDTPVLHSEFWESKHKETSNHKKICAKTVRNHILLHASSTLSVVDAIGLCVAMHRIPFKMSDHERVWSQGTTRRVYFQNQWPKYMAHHDTKLRSVLVARGTSSNGRALA